MGYGECILSVRCNKLRHELGRQQITLQNFTLVEEKKIKFAKQLSDIVPYVELLPKNNSCKDNKQKTKKTEEKRKWNRN